MAPNPPQNSTPTANKRVWDVKYLSENYYIKHNSLEDAKDNKQWHLSSLDLYFLILKSEFETFSQFKCLQTFGSISVQLQVVPNKPLTKWMPCVHTTWTIVFPWQFSLFNIKNGIKVGEPALGPEHGACSLAHSLSHLNSTPTESFMFLFTSVLFLYLQW